MNLLMTTLKIVAEYYPGRLYKAFVIDPPSLFSYIWKVKFQILLLCLYILYLLFFSVLKYFLVQKSSTVEPANPAVFVLSLFPQLVYIYIFHISSNFAFSNLVM